MSKETCYTARRGLGCIAKLCLFAIISFGCNTTEKQVITEEPAEEPIDKWIGAWQYTEYEDGELVPRGTHKIQFAADGTWQLSHDRYNGVYVIFDDRFLIKNAPSSDTGKGSWTFYDNTLKLVYDDNSDVDILWKTSSFEKYTPTTAGITPSPEDGEIPRNTTFRITFNEAVYEVKVNDRAATGSGRTWTFNLADIFTNPRLQGAFGTTLRISWIDKHDIGRRTEADFTIQAEAGWGPAATLVTTSPLAGSEVAPNALLTITLDEAVDGVTVNGAAAAGSGKNWTLNLAGLNLRAGRATLNIHWANKDGTAGAARIALTIQRTDTTAPTIVLSSVSNNDIDVDPVKLNREGITIAFSENVREGDISIRIERGRALSWLVDWSANSVTIIPAGTNQHLELETSYEIRVSTADDSNNRLNKTISFTTKIVK